ncbi:hypothetical protein ACFYVL_34190 [Streptomyces sp. NPDC004111]|uniref:hypothetical protein n=1 Tax=Streptomyces sp. NPDC004111 TaxID=3364690 RepID=UPI0036A4ED31
MPPEETFPRPALPPVWTRVPLPPRAADSGTPIYDALARSWREQGRELPRPTGGITARGYPELPHPRAGVRPQAPIWRTDTDVHESGWGTGPGTGEPFA